MGGNGSGSYYRWNTRTKVEDYLSIDVRKWKREGWLDGYQRFKIFWTVGGEKAGVINVETYERRIVLSYLARSPDGGWEDIKYDVTLDRTPCNYGGSRVWFRCPGRGCGKRVAKLFGGRYFLCRHCHNLPYKSQCEGQLDRVMGRAEKYFNQIRGGNERWWLVKPTGLHWKTYWRLYHLGMAEIRKARYLAGRKWGYMGSDVVEDATPTSPYQGDSKGTRRWCD